MDILRQWKSQEGRGTYVCEHEGLDVVKKLIYDIKQLGNTVTCYGTEAKRKMNSEFLNYPVFDHASGIMFKPKVFLLIILDIDFIPRDVLGYILASNEYKYIFCTSSTDKLNRFHLGIAPIIEVIDQRSKERKISSSNIFDYNISLDLSTDDQIFYDKMRDKMNEIFAFFDGNYDLINNCYRGDPKSGITADIFRRDFAMKNNWSSSMDTSIEYYREVDKYYNPNSIFEKAKLYCDLLAERNHFIDEHQEKIFYLHKLISYYKDKRYLVICKNNYMANKVGDFLSRNNKCQGQVIHGDLKPVHFNDADGNQILYKSGNKKGLAREFGAKSQTSNYANWFNNGSINLLVATSAIDKSLILKDLDIVVYLSPRCIQFQELRKRVNLSFRNNVYIVNVYLTGTKDEDLLQSNQKKVKHSIRNYYKGDINKLKFE